LKARPARAGGSGGAPAHDFSHEYTGLKVKVLTTAGVVEGVLAEASRYWFKLAAGGGTVYVNKAHVITVTPEPQPQPQLREPQAKTSTAGGARQHTPSNPADRR
jgi:hypothetical protein